MCVVVVAIFGVLIRCGSSMANFELPTIDSYGDFVCFCRLTCLMDMYMLLILQICNLTFYCAYGCTYEQFLFILCLFYKHFCLDANILLRSRGAIYDPLVRLPGCYG